jgi:hypothetical protein
LKDYRGKDEDVSIWGVDVDMPLLKTKMLYLLLYADHAQIVDYGNGQTIGLRMDMDALWDFLNLSVNFERRYLGKKFIANYFGPLYEVLRQTSVAQLVDFYEAMGGEVGDDLGFIYQLGDIPITQKMLLPMMMEKRSGWYGALHLNFLKLITVMGSYQFIDKEDNSGALHFGASLSEKIPIFTAEASYDKIGIENFKDVRTLDSRSVARVGVGYKVKPYLLVYMDYIWNFVWSEQHAQYISQERVQPRIAFRYPFEL